jgi:hypothetical protein
VRCWCGSYGSAQVARPAELSSQARGRVDRGCKLRPAETSSLRPHGMLLLVTLITAGRYFYFPPPPHTPSTQGKLPLWTTALHLFAQTLAIVSAPLFFVIGTLDTFFYLESPQRVWLSSPPFGRCLWVSCVRPQHDGCISRGTVVVQLRQKGPFAVQLRHQQEPLQSSSPAR